MYRDPRCVFVADSMGLADIVVVWLGERGIDAQVMNQATLGGLVGLSWFSANGISSHGMEVWVIDPSQAENARVLVEQHERERLAKREEARRAKGEIAAVCEDCGSSSSFAMRYRGTVQDCPHCGAYLDVPEAEENAL
jgi:hypothetical protein